MRCDEVQEGFMDLLYEDDPDSRGNAELREHLLNCADCRKELEELKATRKCLQLWQDESPLQNIALSRRMFRPPRLWSWRSFRYAGIAAMLFITLLALANTRISWNKDGFSFRSSFFAQRETEREYYTKAEFRDIMKQALDDSEMRTNKTNYLMMQKMLDAVEIDRMMDLRNIRNQFSRDPR